VNPVTTHLGGMLAQGVNAAVTGMMPFADGASFSQGRVMPFASGGVVRTPVAFPMRGGTGLMGEAGPEAIMPLSCDDEHQDPRRAEFSAFRKSDCITDVAAYGARAA